MKNFFVPLLVGAVSFFMGVGAFFGYTQYTKLQTENKALREQVVQESIVSPTVALATASSDVVMSSPTLSQQENMQTKQTGSISGTLGYPSEGIPELAIYAFNTSNPSLYFFATSAQNAGTFTINDVDPGTYYIVAYVKSGGNYAGGYTKAVECGLSVNCTDHSLVSVTVAPGSAASGVQVKDWYAPDGAFPLRPGE